MSDARTRMIRRAAREILPGMTVNLGIGLPTKVVNHLSDDMPVCLHTENGLSGVGPTLDYDHANRDLIDAGGAYISAACPAGPSLTAPPPLPWCAAGGWT